MENDSSSDQLRHHAPVRGRGWKRHDVEVKSEGVKSEESKVTKCMKQEGFKISQYACAVLLIVSSIALVAYQVVHIDDVAAGLLYYVAQSFLLAGSIFGLDQYIRIIKKHYHENNNQ